MGEHGVREWVSTEFQGGSVSGAPKMHQEKGARSTNCGFARAAENGVPTVMIAIFVDHFLLVRDLLNPREERAIVTSPVA